MFQYAFGRSTSEKLRCDLKFDLSLVSGKRVYRRYLLNAFNTEIVAASARDIRKSTCYCQENHFCFNPCFYDHKPPIYFIGTWPNLDYFYDIQDKIKKEFTLKPSVLNSPRLQYELSKVKNAESVAIHIRMGDYINSDLFVCDARYYEQAITLMKLLVPSARFFIFSDEKEKAKNFLRMTEKTYNVKGQTDIEDFYLMSQCKHIIMPNSTFSWWAAFLNPNINKRIICPASFISSSHILFYRKIFPQQWIKIHYNTQKQSWYIPTYTIRQIQG